MVIQIGALKSGRDADVQADIAAVVEVAHAAGAIVKVIFENAYLTDDEKVRACRLSEAAGADFVKTSTGFAPSGATHDDLRLMRANTSPHIQVKAAGGVRTLDALLEVMALGVTRIGATPTKAILDDFRARKAGVPPVGAGGQSGAPGEATDGRPREPSASGCWAPASSASSTPTGSGTCRDAAVAANYGRGPERREAFAARHGMPGPTTRSTASAPTPRWTSSSCRCRTTSTSRRSDRAARHGKAVACTKPLGGTRTRPPRCSGSSSEAGVLHAYLENVVFGAEMVRMREMVESGAIGRPVTFRAREGHSGPHAAHFWDAELAGGGRCSTWRRTASRPRATSSARTHRSATAFAWGATLVHRDRTTGEDNAVMIVRFEDGRAATMDVSWSSKGGLEGRFEARGDRRPVISDMTSTPLRAFIEAARRLPRREDRRRHRLGLPGARRDLRPRARRDDGSHGRGVRRRPCLRPVRSPSARARRSATAWARVIRPARSSMAEAYRSMERGDRPAWCGMGRRWTGRARRGVRARRSRAVDRSNPGRRHPRERRWWLADHPRQLHPIAMTCLAGPRRSDPARRGPLATALEEVGIRCNRDTRRSRRWSPRRDPRRRGVRRAAPVVEPDRPARRWTPRDIMKRWARNGSTWACRTRSRATAGASR